MAELFKTIQDLTKEPFIELPKGKYVKVICQKIAVLIQKE